MTKRVLFIVNDLSFFLSHRLPVAIAARKSGYDVVVAAPENSDLLEFVRHGLHFEPLLLSRRGTNPLSEVGSLFKIFYLVKRLQPDILHLVTVKPILYGGFVSLFFPKVATVAAVSGLGPIFVGSKKFSLNRVVVSLLYRVAFSKSRLLVIFQNREDLRFLCDLTGLDMNKTRLIPGSGVDLSQYVPQLEPEGPVRVLFAARFLVDKGLYEFVRAAEILIRKGIEAEFYVAGSPDQGSARAVDHQTLDHWARSGFVTFLGQVNHMPGLIASCAIVALPSYYGEGLPKILVEAAACGRAVVTTDHPGCRDAIRANVTGLLVPPRDAAALASALEYLIVNADIRRGFGRAGRDLAENLYGIDSITFAHLDIYNKLTKN